MSPLPMCKKYMLFQFIQGASLFTSGTSPHIMRSEEQVPTVVLKSLETGVNKWPWFDLSTVISPREGHVTKAEPSTAILWGLMVQTEKDRLFLLS